MVTRIWFRPPTCASRSTNTLRAEWKSGDNKNWLGNVENSFVCALFMPHYWHTGVCVNDPGANKHSIFLLLFLRSFVISLVLVYGIRSCLLLSLCTLNKHRSVTLQWYTTATCGQIAQHDRWRMPSATYCVTSHARLACVCVSECVLCTLRSQRRAHNSHATIIMHIFGSMRSRHSAIRYSNKMKQHFHVLHIHVDTQSHSRQPVDRTIWTTNLVRKIGIC